MNYEQTMRFGEAQYRDVIDALSANGLRVSFTQTGGMNAALDAVLDGGAYLLITDADDSLAWERAEHQGWSVGVYTNDEDQELLAHRASESGDTVTLLRLVEEALEAARPTRGQAL